MSLCQESSYRDVDCAPTPTSSTYTNVDVMIPVARPNSLDFSKQLNVVSSDLSFDATAHAWSPYQSGSTLHHQQVLCYYPEIPADNYSQQLTADVYQQVPYAGDGSTDRILAIRPTGQGAASCENKDRLLTSTPVPGMCHLADPHSRFVSYQQLMSVPLLSHAAGASTRCVNIIMLL